jgi:hypothetical protein
MSNKKIEEAIGSAAGELVAVRALSALVINGVSIAPGRVVVLPAAVAASHVASGEVDDNPDAVSYALTENADIIKPFADVAE